MDREHSVDIDDIVDFVVAESMINYLSFEYDD